MTAPGLAVAILTSKDPIVPTDILPPGNSALISSVDAPLTTKPTVSNTGSAAAKSLLWTAVAAAVVKHTPHCSFHSKLTFLLLLLLAFALLLVVVVVLAEAGEAEAEAEAEAGGGGGQGTQGPTF